VAAGTTPRQLTFEGDNSFPVWSPDANRIAFASEREGTDDWDPFVRTVNDDEAEEQILKLPGSQYVRSWPEDDLVVFESGSNPSSPWTFAPSGGENPTVYLDSDADLDDVVVSRFFEVLKERVPN
jgi:Tol biopolymer transport system component